MMHKLSLSELEQAHEQALRLQEQCVSQGIGIISYYDADFPEMLRHCLSESGKLAPAILLYYRGSLAALTKQGVAMIGTRNPSAGALTACQYFGEKLAAVGFNIVSGLALGCDGACQQAAVDIGGTTTAFLANGLAWENLYPEQHLFLAQQIVECGGLLLSEYAPQLQAHARAFVERDRLQAGLALATIAIQCRQKSGTMHAINATLHSKKPLFVVQYKHKNDCEHEQCSGNSYLLNSGQAQPLRSDNFTDVLSQLQKQGAYSWWALLGALYLANPPYGHDFAAVFLTLEASPRKIAKPALIKLGLLRQA